LTALVYLHVADAFISTATDRVSLTFYSTKSDEAPCAISEDFADDVPSLVNVPNGANSIRSGVVTNYAGDFVRMGDVISKSEPHVVIL